MHVGQGARETLTSAFAVCLLLSLLCPPTPPSPSTPCMKIPPARTRLTLGIASCTVYRTRFVFYTHPFHNTQTVIFFLKCTCYRHCFCWKTTSQPQTELQILTLYSSATVRTELIEENYMIVAIKIITYLRTHIEGKAVADMLRGSESTHDPLNCHGDRTSSNQSHHSMFQLIKRICNSANSPGLLLETVK